MDRYFLIGSPIAHSLSPLIQNTAFSTLGIDAEYGLLETDIAGLPKALEKLRELGARGWNITMPAKSAMCGLCDELSPASAIGGSVNTVQVLDGRLIGHTTDGAGLLNALAADGFHPNASNVVLFGSGGAASAILIELALRGAARITTFARSETSAAHIRAIAEKLTDVSKTQIEIRNYSDDAALRSTLSEASLLVNATNVGMEGGPDPSGCLIPDVAYLHPGLFVCDIIYHPEVTPLLRMAKEAGCRTEGGLAMLVGQAAESFRIWTGREMPPDSVRNVLAGR